MIADHSWAFTELYSCRAEEEKKFESTASMTCCGGGRKERLEGESQECERQSPEAGRELTFMEGSLLNSSLPQLEKS